MQLKYFVCTSNDYCQFMPEKINEKKKKKFTAWINPCNCPVLQLIF